MSDFLRHLAAQALDQPHGLQLRVPSLFEPSPAEFGLTASVEAPVEDSETAEVASRSQPPAAALRPSVPERAVAVARAQGPETSIAPQPTAAAFEYSEPATRRAGAALPRTELNSPAARAPEPEHAAFSLEPARRAPPLEPAPVAPPLDAPHRPRPARRAPEPDRPIAPIVSARPREDLAAPRAPALRAPAPRPTRDPFAELPSQRVEPMQSILPAHALSSEPAPAAISAPTTVSIAIGRIEVRTQPTAANVAPKLRGAPVMTLDAYMRRRRQSRES